MRGRGCQTGNQGKPGYKRRCKPSDECVHEDLLSSHSPDPMEICGGDSREGSLRCQRYARWANAASAAAMRASTSRSAMGVDMQPASSGVRMTPSPNMTI